LTKLRVCCVDLYNMYENKITDSVCGEYDEEKAIEDIKSVIKREKFLSDLSG